MCGICGIVSYNNLDSVERRDSIVGKMNQYLYHRGPDEEGFASFECCSMAMRRLSIIDLQGGSQPIYNETKTLFLFFNGEIYNFPKLKKDLQHQGHKFSTSSDSEVIVHLYEQHGLEMVSLLEGMFVFSLFDKKTNTVIIGRDRFGEKPLYYHESDSKISFSSELNSLLQNPDIPRVLNVIGLKYYLKVGIIPEPLTMFRGVYSLPPGHLMIIRRGKVLIENYFSPHYCPKEMFQSESEAMECLKPLFERAIKKQMISDVPIGAFLSGGIDSSSVAAMMQSQSSNQINTYTVKFENTAYDESKIALEVADYLGTNHNQIVIPDNGFSEDLFWKLLQSFGMPFSDSSCIPTFLVTMEIAKHVKVALSGDGGDEVFGGYRIFQWWKQINSIRRIPIFLRKGISNGVAFLSSPKGPLTDLSLLRQINKAVDFSLKEHLDVPLAMHQMFNDLEISHLTSTNFKKIKYPRYQDYYNKNLSYGDLRQIMNYRLKYNLPSNMLVKVDRMSMANSLEVRAPFLDPNLFEASLRLPNNMLIRGGKGKYIIRKMMRNYLPKSVFNHPKQGFAIPLHTFQNSEYMDLARSLFSKHNPLSNMISLDYTKTLQNMALNSNHPNSKVSTYRASQRLWALMMLFGWMTHFKVDLPD